MISFILATNHKRPRAIKLTKASINRQSHSTEIIMNSAVDGRIYNAWNKGIKSAKGEYLIITDDDLIFPALFTEELISEVSVKAIKGEKWDIMVFHVLNRGGNLHSLPEPEVPAGPKLVKKSIFEAGHWFEDVQAHRDPPQPDYADGTCEDVQWAQRAKKKGFVVVFSTLQVYHNQKNEYTPLFMHIAPRHIPFDFKPL